MVSLNCAIRVTNCGLERRKLSFNELSELWQFGAAKISHLLSSCHASCKCSFVGSRMRVRLLSHAKKMILKRNRGVVWQGRFQV